MARRPRRGRPPGHGARYRELAADLARRLDAGEWPSTQPMPSYRQFAHDYGVGVQAVRLALKALAAEGRVLIRPRRAPQAALGAPLEKVLDQAIGVVCAFALGQSLGATLQQDMLRGVVQAAERPGCPLLFLQHYTRWRHEVPAGLARLPMRGLILLGPFKEPLLRQYESIGLPVVLVDQPGDGFKLHAVTVDNYHGAFNATKRLIGMGHRRIAFIRTLVSSLKNLDPDSRERQAGFADACKAAGLPERDCRVYSSHISGSTAMQEIVRARPRFTAVFAVTSAHAVQTVLAAEAQGLRVPQDLSVIAFRPAICPPRNWSGPLIDFEAMGRRAAELLLRAPAAPVHERLPVAWNAGDSLAPAPGK